MRKEQRRREKESTLRVTISEGGEPLTPENSVGLPAGEWFEMFKKEVLDHKSFGNFMDGFQRNTIRITCEAWTRDFAALPVLRGKNSLWLQLILTDEDRVIQGKLYGLGAEVALAKSHTYVVERSRKLFTEAVPSLLQGGGVDRLIFSRSLFLPGFNGSVDDAVGFPSYDPLACLEEVPQDNPSGVRCTEAFLFLAGDFPTKDGFSSREAILELLHELNSPDGNHILLGFWVCAASAKVRKEKLDELKGIHIPVKRS